MSPPVAAARRDRLRIAIQKSGRLGEPARALLASCGLSWRESRDRLFCYGESLPVDLLLVRDDDIPGLLATASATTASSGATCWTNTGRARGQAACGGARAAGAGLRWLPARYRAAEGQAWDGPAQLEGARIATSYPALLRQWLQANGVSASVVTLSGSVEIAPRLGQADAICDLVSSGATLSANQLVPVATLLRSEAVLAGPPQPFTDARADLAQLLLRRLDGVLKIRDSRLLLFQAPRSAMPGLMKLLPDAEPPTVLQVDGADSLSLQALCHGAMTWQRLEDLKSAGASGLMVLPVERTLA